MPREKAELFPAEEEKKVLKLAKGYLEQTHSVQNRE